MESLEIAGFKKEELTIDMAKAQLLSLIYFLPAAILLGLPYYFFWAVDYNLQTIIDMVPARLSMAMTIFTIFGVLIVGVVLHELIHGLTWSMFAKAGFKSIRFGVVWKFLTPYCHCKEPLLVKHYIIGALMPGLLLGLFPSLIALVTGNLFLFVFGLFFTLAAGGDFMIIKLLRRVDYNALVQDHPSRIGCYIYKPV
jgi:predicted neutral ceramidase superfamily lipid hydrolase